MDDREFVVACRRIKMKRDRKCFDQKYILDVFAVYCAIQCPLDRNELASQLARFLWTCPDQWDEYMEKAKTDHLAKDALRLVLGWAFDRHDTGLRLHFSKDAFGKLVEWSLREFSAAQDGPGQSGGDRRRVREDRNQALVLTIHRLKEQLGVANSAAFPLVAKRLKKGEGRQPGEPLGPDAVKEAWTNNRGPLTRKGYAEEGWKRIETQAVSAADYVHAHDELGHELDYEWGSPLQEIRSLLYPQNP